MFSLTLNRLWKNNLGAVATEYALVIALIAILAASGMFVMGDNLSSFYAGLGSALEEMACAMPETASEKSNGNKCKDKKGNGHGHGNGDGNDNDGDNGKWNGNGT